MKSASSILFDISGRPEPACTIWSSPLTIGRAQLVDVSMAHWYHRATHCLRRELVLSEGDHSRKEWLENRLQYSCGCLRQTGDQPRAACEPIRSQCVIGEGEWSTSRKPPSEKQSQTESVKAENTSFWKC
jgi:hypothetical protein